MNSSKEITEQTPPPAYFGSLTITDVKCFKGKQTIDLSDGNGKPAMWTVILGNNNTGKTTLLRSLANLEPIPAMNLHDLHQRFGTEKSKNDLIPKIARDSIFSDDENYSVKSTIFFKDGNKFTKYQKHWAYSDDGFRQWFSGEDKTDFGGLIIYGYGTTRRMGKSSLQFNNDYQDNSASLFDENVTLTNIEEWLLQLNYVHLGGTESAKSVKKIIKKIMDICTNGLLPNIKDIGFVSELKKNSIADNYVVVTTDYGHIPVRDLGYGYQVTMAWVLDLAKKMFERYPDSDNPLHEPAIVLIDELDLHLHPEWQREIISHLSEQFPRTQFIVTTHSPLIVQSAEDINLVLLKKEDNHVVIEQPKLKTYRGWTVEEILSDLMGLDGKTKSEDYLSLIKTFNKAVMKDDYASAKETYDELDALLHPNNIHRELLNLQLNALSQEADD